MSAKAVLCSCGYVKTGVVPQSLCFDCADRVLAQWVQVERQLLNRIPAYATAVSEIVQAAKKDQAKAIRARSNEPTEEAAWVRRIAGRQLARLRRTFRAELVAVDQSEWVQLADLMKRGPYEVLRNESQRLRKRGLGSAALSALIPEAGRILIRHIDAKRQKL